MMHPQLRQILEELYELEPDLRNREQDLVPIVELLLQNNPGQSPDASFVQELRRQLQARADALSSTSPYPLLTMHKFLYTLGGALTALVLAVPAAYYYTNSQSEIRNSTTPIFTYAVTKTGNEAFGDLSTMAQNPVRAQGGGGGGGGAPMIDSAMPVPTEGMAMDKMMIAPEYTQYEYVIKGELPALDQQTVSVYKRQKGGSNLSLNSIVSYFNLGTLDLSSFAGAKVDMVNFLEDKPFGYSINVHLKEGLVGISQNWEQWPHPEAQCRDEACYRQYQVKLSDVPADDVLISIANAFAQEHGIDLSHYGSPEVDRVWETEYNRAEDKNLAYVPETQRVRYPLLIDGKPVYEEGGIKAGIEIGVHVREKKVTDAFGIADNTFLQSDYAGVTDAQMVQDYLKTIDNYAPLTLPAGTTMKTQTIELGTPTLALVRTFRQTDMIQPEELVVPALVFPVGPQPAGSFYWRQSITVPLAKDILEARVNQPGPGGDPRIMY